MKASEILLNIKIEFDKDDVFEIKDVPLTEYIKMVTNPIEYSSDPEQSVIAGNLRLGLDITEITLPEFERLKKENKGLKNKIKILKS